MRLSALGAGLLFIVCGVIEQCVSPYINNEDSLAIYTGFIIFYVAFDTLFIKFFKLIQYDITFYGVAIFMLLTFMTLFIFDNMNYVMLNSKVLFITFGALGMIMQIIHLIIMVKKRREELRGERAEPIVDVL